ncbi:MAG: hypothetical protein QN178_15740 [Armatimonadota bacterium]|nr:hypothetical protein [Armatimonadota bacterium]
MLADAPPRACAGATVDARRGMPLQACQAAVERALDWEPAHLCEMGADLTVAFHQRGTNVPRIRADPEATGSGIARLAGVHSLPRKV